MEIGNRYDNGIPDDEGSYDNNDTPREISRRLSSKGSSFDFDGGPSVSLVCILCGSSRTTGAAHLFGAGRNEPTPLKQDRPMNQDVAPQGGQVNGLCADCASGLDADDLLVHLYGATRFTLKAEVLPDRIAAVERQTILRCRRALAPDALLPQQMPGHPLYAGDDEECHRERAAHELLRRVAARGGMLTIRLCDTSCAHCDTNSSGNRRSLELDQILDLADDLTAAGLFQRTIEGAAGECQTAIYQVHQDVVSTALDPVGNEELVLELAGDHAEAETDGALLAYTLPSHPGEMYLIPDDGLPGHSLPFYARGAIRLQTAADLWGMIEIGIHSRYADPVRAITFPNGQRYASSEEAEV